ncbi:MAG: hypothetical protein QHC65_16300 [Sphingomonas sp.]|nr:hypothetical protein [Sphingomonas sp.]MDX3885986.1 hypothetical protein [Sphingomonas sp.]
MISLNDIEPFTPKWREGEKKPPVYLIRVGDVIERSIFEAELAGKYGAGQVYAFEFAQAAVDGIQALLAGDPQLDDLLALVNAEMNGDTISADDRQKLARMRDVLTQHWPAYALLIERQARRRELAPVLAFRRFCVGWENVKAEFARDRDGFVSAAALRGIDPLEMTAAGHHTFGLLYAAGEEENFPQPSKSDDAPGTSPSASASKAAAGKSGAKGGRRTRA